ncbi:uncharacterized protein ACRADG_008765 isoform 2-T13 [Cochliomyia hominivorax]
MLPPPITTPTMDDAIQQQQNLNQTQQEQQQHKNISNSFPTIPFNGTSIKNFFNKTLANVTKTNLSDYTSQYSATFFNSSPDSLSSYTSSSSSSSSFSSSSSSPHNVASQVYDGLIAANPLDGMSGTGVSLNHTNGFDSYAAAADMAVASLSNSSHHLETTTAFPTAQTVATFIAGNKNRATTIIVYPTVSPESIVIPIVSCIFGFPILAFIVICCLRHRAKLARERDRRRNYDMQDHAVSLVRFSPIHRLNYRSSRAISLRPERSLSQGFTSLELDTVVEERCSDVEQTQTEILHPESPMESSTTSYKMSFSSS